MSPSSKGTDETVNDALLEKLRNCVSKPQEIDTFRNIAAKIHARVTSTGNHARAPFFYLFYIIYICICSQRCSEFHFIINLTDADSTNSVFRFLFANGTFEKGCHSSGNHLIVVLVSLFTLVSETFTDETRECGIKVFKRLETRLDTLRHGLNRYFYRERWLLFHRANHQKLAQFIIRTALRHKSAKVLDTFPSLRFSFRDSFSRTRPLLIAPLLHERIPRKWNFSTFVTESWSKK